MEGFGTLAQSVEQRTFNPLVGSSSLPRPTNRLWVIAKTKNKIARFSGLFYVQRLIIFLTKTSFKLGLISYLTKSRFPRVLPYKPNADWV